MVSALCISSGTAITVAMAVSLMATVSTEPKAGSMRTMACGRMILRSAWARDMPSASPARIWPGRTDSMPARTTSAA